MVHEFPSGGSALTFGDIGWNRDRCPADLTCEAVYLALRKLIRDRVYLLNEVHSLLPRNQLTVFSNRPFSRHSPLVTRHRSIRSPPEPRTTPPALLCTRSAFSNSGLAFRR